MLLTLLKRIIPGRRVLLLAAAAACALPPAPAAAHTRVEMTAPADGDTAHGAVREVRLRFSRGVEGALTTLSLSRDGNHVASGGTGVPQTDGREYVLALPRPLDPGAYEVQWKTVGADGHVLQGSFDFVVAADPAAPVTAPPPTAAAVAAEAAPPPPPPGEAAGEV